MDSRWRADKEWKKEHMWWTLHIVFFPLSYSLLSAFVVSPMEHDPHIDLLYIKDGKMYGLELTGFTSVWGLACYSCTFAWRSKKVGRIQHRQIGFFGLFEPPGSVFLIVLLPCQLSIFVTLQLGMTDTTYSNFGGTQIGEDPSISRTLMANYFTTMSTMMLTMEREMI